MADFSIGVEVQKSILDRFVLGPFFEFLNRRSPRTRGILIVAICIVLALSAIWVMGALNSYTPFMGQTLGQRLETNDQPYRGLEAYVLSGIRHRPAGHWGAGPYRVAVAALRTRLESPELLDTLPQMRQLPLIVRGTRGGASTSRRDQYITRLSLESFLFQPATFVQGDTLADTLTDASLAKLLPANPQLSLAIAGAECCEQTLSRLDDAQIDGLSVVQSYVITDQGAVLIRSNAAKGVDSSYVDAFPARRYFPERPYFWRAQDGRHRVGEFDYVTAPYIDYGGLGVVRTYVIALEFPRHRRGMIGIDCAIADGEGVIAGRLRTLSRVGAWLRHPTPETIVARRRGARVEFMTGGGRAPSWLDDLAREAGGNSAEILGNITCDHDAHGVAHEGNRFEFAIPVGSNPEGPGTRLMVAAVDLDVVRNLWTPGLLCIAMSILLGGIVQFFYNQNVEERRAQAAMMERVSRVMADAPIPFLWLNEENEFISVNAKGLDVLGYETLERLRGDSAGNRRTFRELIATIEGQAAYSRMLQESAEGKATPAYNCVLRRNDGSLVNVRAHGDRMPFKSIWRNEGPYRFGVFLSWEAKGSDVGRAEER